MEECCLLFITLYSWTTPFCSSSGGGCQETTMAVPLSPLSVTVTSRGGALGAEGCRQKKKKKTHLNNTEFFSIAARSLFRSPVIPLSCHYFSLSLCVRLKPRWEQRTNDGNCDTKNWDSTSAFVSELKQITVYSKQTGRYGGVWTPICGSTVIKLKSLWMQHKRRNHSFSECCKSKRFSAYGTTNIVFRAPKTIIN